MTCPRVCHNQNYPQAMHRIEKADIRTYFQQMSLSFANRDLFVAHVPRVHRMLRWTLSRILRPLSELMVKTVGEKKRGRPRGTRVLSHLVMASGLPSDRANMEAQAKPIEVHARPLFEHYISFWTGTRDPRFARPLCHLPV